MKGSCAKFWEEGHCCVPLHRFEDHQLSLKSSNTFWPTFYLVLSVMFYYLNLFKNITERTNTLKIIL